MSTISVALEVVREYLADHKMNPALNDVLVEACDEGGFRPEVYAAEYNDTAELRSVLDLHYISITNIKGVATRRLEIKPGVTLLYGANDSGKSTFVDAIAAALETLSTEAAQQLLRSGQSAGKIELGMTGAKIERFIEMTIKARGRNAGEREYDTRLVVEAGEDRETKTKRAEALRNAYLGVAWSFIRRACFVFQGELAEMLDEQPAKRRELMYQLLGISCEPTREELSKLLRKKEAAFVQARGAVDDLVIRLKQANLKRGALDLEKLTADYESLTQSTAAAEANTKAITSRLEGLRAQLATWETNDALIRRLTEEVDRLNRTPELAVQVKDLTAPIATHRDQIRSMQGQVANIEGKREEIRARGKRIADLPPVCPQCLEFGWQCGSNDKVKAAKREELLKEFHELDGQANEMRLKIASLITRHDELFAQQGQYTAASRIQAATTAAIKAKTDALEAIPSVSRDDYVAWQKEAGELVVKLDHEQRTMPAETVQRRADVHAKIQEAQQLDAQIVWLTKEQAKTEATITTAKLDSLRTLVDVFGKTGIPLWKARQHLEGVNDMAAQISAGDRYSYRFNEDLAIEITDGQTGAVVAPHLASGSSRQRAALVLRASLGRYLQQQCRLSIPVFWIDEIPFQDESKGALIIEMINRLRQWYPKIILAESRADQYLGHFDYEVVLGGDGSLLTSAEVEAKLAERKDPTSAAIALLQDQPVDDKRGANHPDDETEPHLANLSPADATVTAAELDGAGDPF